MDLSSVYINHIGQKLKSIKRDTDRKYDIGNTFRKTGKGLKVAQKKYRIFENPQKSQQENALQDHIHFPDPLVPPFLDPDTAEPADKGFPHQQDQKPRSSPGIKNK